MSIVEIPLDSEEIVQEKEIENTENTENIKIQEENTENENINEENSLQEEDNHEKNDEPIPAPKRPRGRPKKEKVETPPPAKKQKETVEKVKAVKKAKAKPKKKEVRYEPSSSEEEELPEYARHHFAPQPPATQDIATQMLQLLQNHQQIKTARKRQLYSSWFRNFSKQKINKFHPQQIRPKV